MDILKSFSIRHAVDVIVESWNNVAQTWRKLLLFV
jgi:hypothetical protein